MDPFFSIIIPTFNRARLLSSTIDSVLNQDYNNFELIIVDDGSTDNTSDVIEGFCSRDSRIKYFYKKNEERNIARNYGAAKAFGEYLIFFDSDDTMDKSFLNKYYSHLKDKSIPILSSNIRYKNAIINVFDDFKSKNTTLHLCERGHIYLPCTAFRKDTIDSPFFYPDPNFTRGEDQYRVIKSSISYPFVILPYCGVNIGNHTERSVYIEDIERQIYSYNLMKTTLAPILNNKERRTLAGEFDFILAYSYLKKNRYKSIRYLFRSIAMNLGRLLDKRTYVFMRDWLFGF